MDLDQGFSPEGLKERDRMVALGYDPRTLIPSRDGKAVYDPELDQFLNGLKLTRRFLGQPENPSEAESWAAIAEARHSQRKGIQTQSRLARARGPIYADRGGLISVRGVGRKLATAKALQSESLRVQQIARRWALGAPEKVNQLEADGMLLQRLKEQADIEEIILAGARVSGAFSGAPDHEILRQHGIAELPE